MNNVIVDGESGYEDEEKSKQEYNSENNIEEPSFEPECSALTQVTEESDLECEFEVRNGSWWCLSHNCHA